MIFSYERKMNKIKKTITKDGSVSYTLIVEDGTKFDCSRWYEKKTESWHVKLPKDNPSGRTYVRESFFEKADVFEFETKTQFRTGLTSGGWKAKMTEEEAAEMEKLEARIAEIKEIASARETVKIDPNSPEGIALQIEKLRAKLAKATKA